MAFAAQWACDAGETALIGRGPRLLRQRLQEITEIQDIGQHEGQLTALMPEHPHSIHVVQSPHPVNRYTCLLHVFDFVEKDEYIAIADYGLGNVYAGREFAEWLLEHGGVEEVQGEAAGNGELVMYFHEGVFRHVGLLQDNQRVVSKWGQGLLYDHALLEVPSSYGNQIRWSGAESARKGIERTAGFRPGASLGASEMPAHKKISSGRLVTRR